MSDLPLLATLLLAVSVPGLAAFVIHANAAFFRREDVSGRDKIWITFFAQILAAFTVPWGTFVSELVERHLGVQNWVPARVWAEAQTLGIRSDDLSGLTAAHPWLSSLMQWHAYRGLYCALALSLSLLGAAVAIRVSRSTEGGFRSLMRHGKIAYLRRVAKTISRALAVAGTLALVVYAVAVPAVIEERQAYYDRRLARLVDPEATHREIEAEMENIRNDDAQMRGLRQKGDM